METVFSGQPWMNILFELPVISRSQNGAAASDTGGGREKEECFFDERS